VVGIRGPGRIPHILQLPGGVLLRWRIFAEVFRGVVLLRRHRAGQPEPGPVHGAGLHHVLRAPAQGGRAGRHRAHAGVHPGHGPGRGGRRSRPAARLPVLLGRRDGRLHGLHMAVRGRRARVRHTGHLAQRPRPDHRIRPGHVPVPRAWPRLRTRQQAAGHGRGRGGPLRPPGSGLSVAGHPGGPAGRHVRRLRPAGGPPQPSVRPGPAAQVAVQYGPPNDGRIPHHRAVGRRAGRPAVCPRGRRAHRGTCGRDTLVPGAAV